MEWKDLWEILNSPVVYVPVGIVAVGVIDAVVRKTQNKTDDMIWNKWIRGPIMEALERRRVKTETPAEEKKS